MSDTPITDGKYNPENGWTGVVPIDHARNLERQLAEKTDAIQDAANLVDEWRNRARRDRDKSVEWEEKHNALERQLAEVTKQRDALANAIVNAADVLLAALKGYKL